MRVQNLMDRKYPSFYADELATKARAVLRSRGFRVLLVVKKGKLVGMVDREDIVKALL